LIVTTEFVQLTETGLVGAQQCAATLRPRTTPARITEEGRVRAPLPQLTRQLRRVGHDVPFTRLFPLRPQWKSFRRDETLPVHLRIGCGKEEEAVLHDRAAHFKAAVTQIRSGLVHGFDACRRGRLHLFEGALRCRRLEVAERRSAESVRPGLRHYVDHAASRLPVLSFEAAGHHLNFLDEVERNAGAKGSQHDRVGAERSVPRVGDIDPVDHVLVLEPARAGYRRVRAACAAAAAHARCDVKRIAQATLDRYARKHPGIDVRLRGRFGDVHDRGAAAHFDRFGDAADFKFQRQFRPLPEPYLHVAALRRPETGELSPHHVDAWRQEWSEVPSLLIRHQRLCSLGRNDRDRHAWQREPLWVRYLSPD